MNVSVWSLGSRYARSFLVFAVRISMGTSFSEAASGIFAGVFTAVFAEEIAAKCTAE